MSNDPDLTRAGAGQDQADDGELLARAGIRGRRHRRRHFGARPFRSLWRGALPRPRWNATPALKAGKTSLDPRAQDFLSSHPATPERVQNAQAGARQYSSPQGGERDRETYLAAIDNIVYGEDPSEGFVRGRRFLHPKLGFTFAAPDTFTLDNTAQAVIGVREGGTQAMRFDVVRVPAEQTLGDYLNSGWMEGVDKASTEDLTINGFPAASATAQWRPVAVQGLRAALRQRRLSLHLRRQAEDHRERAQRARDRQLVPPPDAGRNPGRAAAAHQGHHRAARRHRGIAVAPHGRRRPPRRALPHPQRPRQPRPGQAAGPREDRGGLSRSLIAVIASEAKQSISLTKQRLDCFVASLLAMTSVMNKTKSPVSRPGFVISTELRAAYAASSATAASSPSASTSASSPSPSASACLWSWRRGAGSWRAGFRFP